MLKTFEPIQVFGEVNNREQCFTVLLVALVLYMFRDLKELGPIFLDFLQSYCDVGTIR